MFIKSWIRTLLIWVGLILFWLLNFGVVGYGEPYQVIEGDWIYTYQDVLPSYGFIFALAVALTMTGCYIWTRLKNRHWGFMFWGLLTPIGLLGISFLKNKTVREEKEYLTYLDGRAKEGVNPDCKSPPTTVTGLTCPSCGSDQVRAAGYGDRFECLNPQCGKIFSR